MHVKSLFHQKNKALCVVTILFLFVLTSMASAETLSVWAWNTDEQYRMILDWYKEENPGFEYELNLISGSQGDFTEKLMIAIAGGSPPDLTWLEGSTVVELAAQGLLTDVTRLFEGVRFTPADAEEMTYEGKMWAAPYFTTSRGLGKRVDLLLEAGVDPGSDPEDLDALWEWNRKLSDMQNEGEYRRIGFVPWSGNWGPPGWIWAFGGQLVDETGMKPTATHPQNIAAFEWIQEWSELLGGARLPSANRSGLLQGTAAMATVSTSDLGWLLEQDVEVTTGRVPHAPGGQNGTWGGGQAVGIPYNAPNKQLAIDVLQYFGSEEVQARRFEHFPTVFPANWDALQDIVRDIVTSASKVQLYAALLEQLPEARARTPLWIDYYVRQLNPQMSEVVAGRLTPQAALENVQRSMEARFAEVFGH